MAVGPAVDPSTVADWLVDGDELAVLDAREQGVFLTGHLFHAACVPLSHLELQLPGLVPRHDTRIVWCDDGDGDLAERACRAIARARLDECCRSRRRHHGVVGVGPRAVRRCERAVEGVR